VVLEDLHAADPSSLLLLELLASQIPTAPLLVVGTHREAAVDVGDVGALLLRIARGARRVVLRRFARPDVTAFLTQRGGAAPRPELVDALLHASEGNPLFLAELSRWIDDPRHADPSVSIPATLRAVIRERLTRVPGPTLELLEAASVLGRDVDLELLAAICDRSLDETAAMLDGIATTGVLENVRPRRRRFSHVLVREALYGELTPERRTALHLRCADACVQARPDTEPAWSELAHHLLAAGPAGRERGIEAAICAAERAAAQYAFDDAVTWFQRALDRVDAEVPWMRRAELLLALGRARMLAGDVEAGRSLCAEAAEMARVEGAVPLLARAALEYGAVFMLGQVSGTLVALLREALEALPVNEVALRARVRARLAAALQPATDPEVPIAMAREAVASARTVGDPVVLLDVVRSAGSALADLAAPMERRALDREHLALAERLGDSGEALRGATRLAFDALELGDGREAESAVSACEHWCERLGTVHALWRGAAMRATFELYRGRFAEAAAAQARACALGEQARDPNARRALPQQAVLAAWLEGRDEEAMSALAALRPVLQREPFERALLVALEGIGRARLGAVELDQPLRESIDFLRTTQDTSALRCCAELALRTGDRELMLHLADALRGCADRFVNFGAFASFVGEPVALFAGRLEGALGRRDEASAMLRQAVELSRTAGARPALFWSLLELAAQGGGEEAALREEAITIARELVSPSLLSRVELVAPRIAVPPALATDGPLELRRLGDVWEVCGSGSPLYVRDTKGVRMLSRLVDAPGRSLHVLDLVGDGSGAVVDIGDAGPIIDPQARDAYRRRIASLRAEIDEADSWNDSARAARAREELEALEKELAAAIGLGGRSRRSHSAIERARVNVQRRLKDVVRRITADRPELGHRLERALTTGVHCRYDPDR
jgi:tetratricopeptide (TPR) repeat protein